MQILGAFLFLFFIVIYGFIIYKLYSYIICHCFLIVIFHIVERALTRATYLARAITLALALALESSIIRAL
jgi:hypothetical protein